MVVVEEVAESGGDVAPILLVTRGSQSLSLRSTKTGIGMASAVSAERACPRVNWQDMASA